MAKASQKPLQPNPFNTHRDPETGLWIVVKTSPLSNSQPTFELEVTQSVKINEESNKQ